MSASELETLFFEHVKQAGLPLPEREYKFCPTRKFLFDFCWPKYRFAVEIDGGTYIRKYVGPDGEVQGGRHNTPTGYERDCEKGNLAVLNGWQVLHFTSKTVNSGEALRVLISMFSIKGFYLQHKD